MWQITGGWLGEIYTKAEPLYMNLFWNFAYGLITVAAIIYFILRRDISETLAIVATFLIMLWSGLEDILFYLFKGLSADQTLLWLDNHIVMGGAAKLIGFEHVTNVSLFVTVAVSAVAVYFIVKWLRKQNFKITKTITW